MLRIKCPWYDSEAKEAKRSVCKLEKKFIKYKLPSLWCAYKAARNWYYGMLNAKKKTTIRNKIKNCANDSKQLYKLINNLTNKQVDTKWPPHKDEQSLADQFADYFETKILKIREMFTTTLAYTCEQLDTPRLAKFAALTEGEVRKVIASLNTKSFELDPIPTHILKEMLDPVLPLITKIVNLSLKTGTFSQDWKIAIVRPLLKKLGLALISSNFWPVSNPPFISKVVKRSMLLQIIHHYDTYNLQPDHQSPYHSDYSCETAVLHLSNDILWVQENQSITALVAIDLSAAFDTVDHDILLKMLKNKYGIDGKALKWFYIYLRPRSFKVITDDTYSKNVNLTVSVPQGSCAGANIFNLYCSLLETIMPKDLAINGFADDHSIRKFFKASDRSVELAIIAKLQECMLNIKQWMDIMHLKMNPPPKTEFIYFGYPRQLHKCTKNSINVTYDLILRSDMIRYLGTWLDSSLNL